MVWCTVVVERTRDATDPQQTSDRESHQTGRILAEVGFLLVLFAGVWLIAAQIPTFKMPTARTIVAGTARALAGLLLVIATRWGRFGCPDLIDASDGPKSARKLVSQSMWRLHVASDDVVEELSPQING